MPSHLQQRIHLPFGVRLSVIEKHECDGDGYVVWHPNVGHTDILYIHPFAVDERLRLPAPDVYISISINLNCLQRLLPLIH